MFFSTLVDTRQGAWILFAAINFRCQLKVLDFCILKFCISGFYVFFYFIFFQLWLTRQGLDFICRQLISDVCLDWVQPVSDTHHLFPPTSALMYNKYIPTFCQSAVACGQCIRHTYLVGEEENEQGCSRSYKSTI